MSEQPGYAHPDPGEPEEPVRPNAAPPPRQPAQPPSPPPPPGWGPAPPPGQPASPPRWGYGPPPGQPYPPAPPGWYPPTAPSPSDEKLWSVLAHAGTLVLGFIAPLVVLLVYGERSPYIRHHAVEALNFQITATIAAILAFFTLALLVGFLLLPLVIAFALVIVIVAAIQAGQGAWYRYPINLRLVK